MTIYTANNGLLGGTGDIMLEVGTENWDNYAFTPSAPQCSVGPEPSVRFNFTVAGADAHIATSVTGGSTYGYVVYLDVFAETLGQETAIMSNPANGYRPLRLRPDGKIAVYDSAGNLLGMSTSSAAGVWRQIVLVEDGTVTPRAIYLYVDSVVEMAATSVNQVFVGMTSTRSANGWGWGDKLPAGQSTGTVYRLRNALLRSFTAASESPSVMQWPALRAAERRVPTAEGHIHDWAEGTTPSPNTWQDVDEFPNDGSATYIATSYGFYHYFRSDDFNPLPANANVLGVQVFCMGLTGPSYKLQSLTIFLGGNNYLFSTNLVTDGNWRGFAWLFIGSYSRSLFDPGSTFEFGLLSQSGTHPQARVSNICYQIVYWTDLLPLAAQPSPPSVKRHYSFIY